MKKNYILLAAAALCKIAIIAICLACITVFGLVLTANVKPELLKYVTIKTGETGIQYELHFNRINAYPDPPGKVNINTGCYLNRLTSAGIVFMGIYKLIKLFIFLAITLQIQAFIKSVGNYTSFREGNVKVFRRIAFLSLSLFAMQFFPVDALIMKFIDREAYCTRISWNLDFTYLSAFLFAMILSEVFREGQRLKSESELTI